MWLSVLHLTFIIILIFLRLSIGFLKFFQNIFFGERGEARTPDLLIKSQLLYRLSYTLVNADLLSARTELLMWVGIWVRYLTSQATPPRCVLSLPSPDILIIAHLEINVNSFFVFLRIFSSSFCTKF